MSQKPLTSEARRRVMSALGNDAIGLQIADKLDGLAFAGAIPTLTGLGPAEEQSLGVIHFTKIPLAAVSVPMVDGTTNGSIGNKKIYTFPTGLIRVVGALTQLNITAAAGITATAAVKHSLGIIPAATNDTLSLTKANIIPSTSLTLASSAGDVTGKSTATAVVALTDSSGGTPSDTLAAITGSYVEATIENTVASLAAKINELIALQTLNGTPVQPLLDGVSAAKDVYLNFGVADAGSTGNSTLTVTGFVYLCWAMVGQSPATL